MPELTDLELAILDALNKGKRVPEGIYEHIDQEYPQLTVDSDTVDQTLQSLITRGVVNKYTTKGNDLGSNEW